MGVLPIVKTEGESTPEILLTKCEKVKAVDTGIKQLAQDLIDTALVQHDPEAAGLAAPQLGINKRVCLVREFRTNADTQENIIKDHILINPEITGNSTETDVRWEACLSIPGLTGRVQRYKRVNIKAMNLEGEEIKIKATGFFGRVIQHEIDHLNGVLFTSKVVGDLLTDEELDELQNMQLAE